ncbi:unnamed protein product [Camellia sinensis]
MAIVHVLGLYILCFYIFLIVSPIGCYSVSDSEALLKLKKSFTNTTAIDSWASGSSPCVVNKTWVGLNCENGLVSILRLEDMGLSGKIDVDALLGLEGLRVISLQNNAFSGSIPELNRLGALKAIFLSNNRFSGEIPADFFEKMQSLRKVWLGMNNFRGRIPESLVKLHNLAELHLENNHFSGPIPSLEQPSLNLLDLSNNSLEGEIPASLLSFDMRAFQGNVGLCGPKIGNACSLDAKMPHPTPSPNSDNADPNESNKIAAGLMTTTVVILSVMIVAIFVLKRRQENFNLLEKENLEETLEVRVSSVSKKDMNSSRKGMGSSKRGSHNGKGGGADLVLVNEESVVFGLTDLMKAGAEVLGNGSLGSSYKAMMTNGMTVVVKRIKEMNKLGKEGFDAEIKRHGRLRHQNVLPPLAYHYRKDEKLLVSEFVPKGSLLYLLHGDRGPSHAELNWPTRLKIVQGIARGLGYLHTELASSDLPHGNLKSSNILVSPDSEPLLVDYGFNSLVSNPQAIQSLLAYKSPEAIKTQEVCPKCDVYCLGIVILEILTGKFPSQYLNNGKGGTDVVQWVRSAISEGREAEVLDPEITNSKKSVREMERLLHIAAACTESNPDQRPEMGEVVRKIEEVRIEGDHEARTIEVLPSLRDGYADQTYNNAHVANVQEGYGGVLGRRYDGSGDRSTYKNNDSFAFDIS